MNTSRRTFLQFTILTAATGRLHAARVFAQQTDPTPIVRHDLQFRVDVDLVRLSVTARDASGNIVHDLARDDFKLLEDDVEQELTHFAHHESPISVVLLLDKSGSMADEKLMHAKDGVINFVRALRQQDEVLVMAFSASVDTLGDFGLNARTIERAIKRVDSEGGTRLYDAVLQAARAIASPARKEKRAILVLSDGEDTGSLASLEEAVEAVRWAEVPAYAIGIELENGGDAPWRRDSLWKRTGYSAVSALTRITDGTGGWTYPIDAAKRCNEVCLRVADELRNQYVLGYYPLNRDQDGGWREIAVRVSRPGVTLTTREGYYAPAS